MMMTGARSGASSGIRRFMAGILARDVSTFVVPGSEIARAYGIDLFKAGLRVVDTPRHAAILLVVGPIAKNLQDAVAVTYAQMPRPRVLLALGVDDPAMLPVVDIMAPLSQDGLLAGVVKFRKIMAADGFHDKAIDFTASALEIQIDYTCPMHPEVVSDKPGSCPKCGMTLVPRETAVGTGHVSHAALGNKPVTSKGHSDHKHSEHKHHGHDHGGKPGVSEAAVGYTCPMHPDVVSDKPGSCPECGMTLVPVGEASADHSAHKHSNHKHEHHGHDHGGTPGASEAAADYTCPMHPEVVSDKPGSCPKCGMTLVPRETAVGTDHVSHAALGNKPVTSKGHSDHKHSEHKQGHHGHDHGGTPGVSEAAAGYTCPMHPDVVSDKPGSCPECGMTLVPVGEASADHSAHKHSGHKHEHHGHDHGGTPGASEAAADYICPMHPDVVSDKPGSCPECGMTLVPVGEASVDHSAHKHSGHKHSDHKHSEHKHHGHDHGGKPGVSEVAAGYTCPMHPDVVSDKPGSCPECGMTLVPAGVASVDHSDHKHSGHKHGHHEHGQMAKIDGIEPGFMSMVDLTKDLPRSSDGLQMDWVKVPFGPFFPGLPGGLGLDLTLDGDTVAASDLRSLVGYVAPLVAAPLTVENFVAEMVSRMRQAPVSYKILAFKAMEAAAGAAPAEGQMRSRVAVLERERIASHLSWLSSFGTQASFSWLAEQAAFLQIKVQAADIPQMAHITPAILALLRRLQRTPLLRMRLVGIGQLEATVKGITGPVARGLGQIRDARADDAAFAALDFKAALRTGGDAFARFYVRCDEIRESLRLIALAGLVDRSEMAAIGSVSGDGAAIVETPRGKAGLKIHLEDGMITEAELETPSTGHMGLVSSMIEQQELGDALVAVASLDLSPWEIKL